MPRRGCRWYCAGSLGFPATRRSPTLPGSSAGLGCQARWRRGGSEGRRDDALPCRLPPQQRLLAISVRRMSCMKLQRKRSDPHLAAETRWREGARGSPGQVAQARCRPGTARCPALRPARASWAVAGAEAASASRRRSRHFELCGEVTWGKGPADGGDLATAAGGDAMTGPKSCHQRRCRAGQQLGPGCPPRRGRWSATHADVGPRAALLTLGVWLAGCVLGWRRRRRWIRCPAEQRRRPATWREAAEAQGRAGPGQAFGRSSVETATKGRHALRRAAASARVLCASQVIRRPRGSA